MADEIYKLLENLTNALEGVSGDLRENALLDKEMAAVGHKLGVKSETVKKVQDADKALGGSGKVEAPQWGASFVEDLMKSVQHRVAKALDDKAGSGNRTADDFYRGLTERLRKDERGPRTPPGRHSRPAAEGDTGSPFLENLYGPLPKRLQGPQVPGGRTPPTAPAPASAPPPEPERRQASVMDRLTGVFDRMRGFFVKANTAVSDPKGVADAGADRQRRAERIMDRSPLIGWTNKLRGGGQQALGHALAGLGNPNETRAFGSFLSSAGSLAGMLPGVGKPLQALAKLGEVVLTSVDRLQQWNNQLRESDLRFAEFSASMIAVQVQSDIRYMNLSRERGERRAFSADMRERSAFGLDKTMAPIEDAAANIKNVMAAVMSEVMKNFVQDLGLDKVAEAINKAFPDVDKNRELLDLVAFGEDIDARERRIAHENRPNRFPGTGVGDVFSSPQAIFRGASKP